MNSNISAPDLITTAQPRSSADVRPVSVIVPVLNEADNLPDCLASVSWADEVFVVDSHSKDSTCDIAERLGANLVQFDYRPGGPRKKNWSLDNLPFRNEWVLIVDADERITPELKDEITAVLASSEPLAGYYLNRKHIFLGKWLRHGGNYPSWNLRLFRHPLGRYEKLATEDLASAGDVEVHEHVAIDGPAGYLREPMLHLDFKDLSRFIDRHNRYSSWDARMRQHLAEGKEFSTTIHARLFGAPVERKRFLKRLWIRLPFRPLARFLYMYFLRLGFLDGRPGYMYCVFKAIQEFHIEAKTYESKLQAAQGTYVAAAENDQPVAPANTRDIPKE